MKTRLTRIHQKTRIKYKRLRQQLARNFMSWSGHKKSQGDERQEILNSREFKTTIENPKACSCSVCTNPRRYYKNSHHAKTKQENTAPTVKEFEDEINHSAGENTNNDSST